MTVLPAYMCAHNVNALCPRKAEEGVRSPGTGLTDGCVSPFGYWGCNLDPLQEEQEPEAILKQDIASSTMTCEIYTLPHACPFSPPGSLRE